MYLSHICVPQSQSCPLISHVTQSHVLLLSYSRVPQSVSHSCVLPVVSLSQSVSHVPQSQLCPTSRVPQSVSQSVMFLSHSCVLPVVSLSHRCFSRSHVTKEVVSLLLFLFCTRQNIDSLERLAGVEESRLTEAHGTFHTSHCLSCRKEYSQDWIKGSHLFIDSTSLDTVHPIPV